MKRLWWVRHAPTHAKSMIGWTDINADLSDNHAFERLTAALPEGAPIISSDLRRAVGTAGKLSRGRLLLPVDQDLREIHFGAWEGLTFDQASAQNPETLSAFWEQPGNNSTPQGESWNDLQKRVDRAAERLLSRPENDIIVVAHFGSILCQVQRAKSITTTQAFAQKIDNLSLTCLSFNGVWKPETVNQIM